jgi:hypothetical protein
MEEEEYTRGYCKKITINRKYESGRKAASSLTCIKNKSTHNFECISNKGSKHLLMLLFGLRNECVAW